MTKGDDRILLPGHVRRGYRQRMGKKKEQYSSSAHLHLITRKLLISIEERIERINMAEKDEFEKLKNTHELLFGNKTPIAGNLVILAELLEKLGDVEDNDAVFSTHGSGNKLSEADIALVEEFVKKLKMPLPIPAKEISDAEMV